MNQPGIRSTTLYIVGDTPLKVVWHVDGTFRAYVFDTVEAGDFLRAPDFENDLAMDLNDDLEVIPAETFEDAVDRLRAEHVRLASDRQAVARAYYDCEGEPILFVTHLGKTGHAYRVLRSTGELAWSSLHSASVLVKIGPTAREIDKAEFDRMVQAIRSAVQKDGP